ncbi:hypothetical protein [Collimonas sp. OK412]|jgi:hypothetical protein|uniref:hypothetical protein n=1 Tax=Collimonas sp. (strain OK412) TaxID=1801619 RepID=UPI0008F3FDE4|nr:hypothetical protein [Collimonas sp. OK412]SFD11067.1 hypothetical protein SAMN04515619_12354 [Collimonas sp. OK412]
MTEDLTFSIAPIRHAPTERITSVLPKHYLYTSKCEEDLDISVDALFTQEELVEMRQKSKEIIWKYDE